MGSPFFPSYKFNIYIVYPAIYLNAFETHLEGVDIGLYTGDAGQLIRHEVGVM
jgi:hypothetical protein